jgi:myo-inositol-1(or 4)-monophosphatase
VSVTGDRDDLELAERAARAAVGVLMGYYGRPPEGLGSKSSDTDLVSDADREAERVVRELLDAERPGDGLLAEEGSDVSAASGRRWLVDPLDGTVNFLYGFPAWAVSVALEDVRGMSVGVVLDPVRDECFAAQRGGGARLNGEPLAVSSEVDLRRAMVATGFSYEPERRARQADLLLEVLPRVRDIRRAGAAALDLCYLAAGRVDAYYERGLNPWDWAAGRLIVEEAGGVVADLDGDPHGLAAAATIELQEALLELVRWGSEPRGAQGPGRGPLG